MLATPCLTSFTLSVHDEAENEIIARHYQLPLLRKLALMSANMDGVWQGIFAGIPMLKHVRIGRVPSACLFEYGSQIESLRVVFDPWDDPSDKYLLQGLRTGCANLQLLEVEGSMGASYI